MAVCLFLRVPFFVCKNGAKADMHGSSFVFLGRHFVFIAASQEDADMRHFI